MTVHVVALGGTIASTGSGGVVPNVTGVELARAAGIDTPLSFTQLAQASSGSLTFDHLLAVAAEVDEAASAGAEGVVVTQGTDTLEETAFALSLLCPGTIPTVVTGAMRNPTLPGADGPANLRAAVRVASAPVARALGTVVVMGDEIHDPLVARKAHTTLASAFSSGPGAGPIGSLVEGRVRLPYRPAGPPLFAPGAAPRPGTTVPPVALLTATLGDDLRLASAAVEAGYAGLVLAGVGGGHVAEDAVPVLAGLAQRIPVVLTGRPGAGEVVRETYGYPGGEIDLYRRGLIPGGVLTPLKARIALALLLAAGRPAEDLSAYA